MRSACITALAIFILGTTPILAADSVDFYVSPTGDDSASGAKENPFAHLIRARDAARNAHKSNPTAPITIYLRQGIHRLSSTLELSKDDSGTAEAPVIWRAFPGEFVRIVGSRAINNPVKVADAQVRERFASDVRDKILLIDLKSQNITDFGQFRARGASRPYVISALELFINGKALELSRWPDKGYQKITKVVDVGSRMDKGAHGDRGGAFLYDSDRPGQWKSTDDIWIHGMFGTVWADDTVRLASLDAKQKKITLAEPHYYGITGGHFCALNILEELRHPNQYYLDRAKGILYFYPPQNVENAELEVSMLEDALVAMQNASHVIFRDITFEMSRGMGIYIEEGDSNLIAGCTFRNLGTVAVNFGQGIEGPDFPAYEATGKPASRVLGNIGTYIYWNTVWNRRAGTNHGIVGCDIHDIGEGGIILSGGDRVTLTPAHNYVRNCYITRTNRLTSTYRPGIWIDGVGNSVEHCRIEHLPHSAILFCGNEHIIDFNYILDTVNDSDDGGAIYAGRDVSIHGTKIRSNFISSTKGGALGFRSGVYLDDHVAGIEISGNVFHNNSIPAVVSGRYNKVFNNILVNNVRGISLDGRGLHAHDIEILKQIPADKEPWKTRYPDAAKVLTDHPGKSIGTEARNNISFGSPCITYELGIDKSFLTVADNIEFGKDDPGFVDLKSGNYGLRDDSVVFAKLPKFQKIPWEKIGLYKDEYRKATTQTAE